MKILKLGNTLNIKGAVLDKNQLENYLEKVASEHTLQNKSEKQTYPIPRLQENFKFITKPNKAIITMKFSFWICIE